MRQDGDLDSMRMHEYEATVNLLAGHASRSFSFFTKYLWVLLTHKLYEKAADIADVLSEFGRDLPDDLKMTIEAVSQLSSGNSVYVSQLREYEFPTAVSELVAGAIRAFSETQASILSRYWAVIPQNEALKKVAGNNEALDIWYDPADRDGLLHRKKTADSRSSRQVETIANAVAQLND